MASPSPATTSSSSSPSASSSPPSSTSSTLPYSFLPFSSSSAASSATLYQSQHPHAQLQALGQGPGQGHGQSQVPGQHIHPRQYPLHQNPSLLYHQPYQGHDAGQDSLSQPQSPDDADGEYVTASSASMEPHHHPNQLQPHQTDFYGFSVPGSDPLQPSLVNPLSLLPLSPESFDDPTAFVNTAGTRQQLLQRHPSLHLQQLQLPHHPPVSLQSQDMTILGQGTSTLGQPLIDTALITGYASQTEQRRLPQNSQSHQPSQQSASSPTSSSLPTPPPHTADLDTILATYAGQPELLKLIIASKTEEDRRWAEEAKLKMMDLMMRGESRGYVTGYDSLLAADNNSSGAPNSTGNGDTESGSGANNSTSNSNSGNNNAANGSIDTSSSTTTATAASSTNSTSNTSNTSNTSSTSSTSSTSTTSTINNSASTNADAGSGCTITGVLTNSPSSVVTISETTDVLLGRPPLTAQGQGQGLRGKILNPMGAVDSPVSSASTDSTVNAAINASGGSDSAALLTLTMPAGHVPPTSFAQGHYIQGNPPNLYRQSFGGSTRVFGQLPDPNTARKRSVTFAGEIHGHTRSQSMSSMPSASSAQFSGLSTVSGFAPFQYHQSQQTIQPALYPLQQLQQQLQQAQQQAQQQPIHLHNSLFQQQQQHQQQHQQLQQQQQQLHQHHQQQQQHQHQQQLQQQQQQHMQQRPQQLGQYPMLPQQDLTGAFHPPQGVIRRTSSLSHISQTQQQIRISEQRLVAGRPRNDSTSSFRTLEDSDDDSDDDYSDHPVAGMSSRPGSALSMNNMMGGNGETSLTLDFSDMTSLSGHISGRPSFNDTAPTESSSMPSASATGASSQASGASQSIMSTLATLDQKRKRKRREMQPVSKVVDSPEPHIDYYVWKNNGNTVQKKTGCKSIYFKCSNSAAGCTVNKTVTEKEGGGYLTKYRGEHLDECVKMQRAQMAAQESFGHGGSQALSHREQ
ncbi:hypothetical protein BGZ94_003541 [Podila epigama]|nr:hypothetical protein BGZ94_003541 [Podila epigama]